MPYPSPNAAATTSITPGTPISGGAGAFTTLSSSGATSLAAGTTVGGLSIVNAAGAGLTSTGSTVDAVGTTGQIVVAADSIGLATTAVTPGTYNSVTVDSFGRAIAGSTVAESFAFSSVAVATQPTIVADAATDTLNIAAGANIGITTDAATDTVTLAVVGTVPNATDSATVGGRTPGDTAGQLAINGNIMLLKGFTVAGLPAGVQGNKAFVTDALAPTYLTGVVGGGAVVTEVFYNGTAWVCT